MENSGNCSEKLSKSSLVEEVKNNFPKFIIDYDDFLAKFDLTDNDLDDSNVAQLRSLVKYALTFKSAKDKPVECNNVTGDESRLDAFRTQISSADLEIFKQQLREKGDALLKLKEVENAFDVVTAQFAPSASEARNEENDEIIFHIKKDFVKQQKLLDNMIITKYKANYESYKKVLTDLLEAYFEDQTQYIPVPRKSQVVQDETIQSLVEYNPKDCSKFRLLKLF